MATVVASQDLDDETVYRVVKAVFDDIERMRSSHPAFGKLQPAKMITDGLSAPLHDGAMRYYREKGLR